MSNIICFSLPVESKLPNIVTKENCDETHRDFSVSLYQVEPICSFHHFDTKPELVTSNYHQSSYMSADCVIEDDELDVIDNRSVLDNSIFELVCASPQFVKKDLVVASSNILYYPKISHNNYNSHDAHEPSHK